MIQSLSGTGPTPPLAAAGATRGASASGKEEFLHLLVTQLQHQDPLNPMQPEQFAAQLAQFSAVEQLIGVNEKLTAAENSQLAMMQAVNSGAAVSTLGKHVLAVGDGVVLGEDPGSVTVAVPAPIAEARLRIYRNGVEVGARDLGGLAAGRQEIDLGSAAEGLPPGNYTYAVEAYDATGAAVPVTTFVTGRIDGVRYGPDGPVLLAGPLMIPLGNVAEILSTR